MKYLVIILLLIFSLKSEYRILTNDEPPTNYVNNGYLTGIAADVVKEIKSSLDLDDEIKVYPWMRVYNIALKKPNTVIFVAGKTEERVSKGFHFIGPVTTKKHILYRRKDSGIKVNSLADIRKNSYSLGCMRGDWRASYFEKRGFNVDLAKNHYLTFKMFIGKRFDLWILSDLEAPGIVMKEDADINSIEPAFTFKENESYILISKDSDTEFVNSWKSAYKKLEDSGFMKKNAQKWSSILGINIEYKKGKGYFMN